jgi:ABC-type multidrug transport system ATPase subunit
VRVELRSVSRRFGRLVALDRLSLEIPSGRRIALIGPNGSGKSTLTRILMGMIRYDGEASIDGMSPHRDRDRLAARLAYVPQTTPQLNATVEEIVSAVAAVRGCGPADVQAIASILDFDLDAVADKPIRALSGGMKQKLLLSLAFATRIGLVILDEPTASLDAPTRAAFFRLIEERTGDATLILCSHRLEEIRHLVDHVVALDEGRLAWQGPLEEWLGTWPAPPAETRTTAPVWLEAR